MCCASLPGSPAPLESDGTPGRSAAGAGVPLAVFDLDGTLTRFDTLAPFLARCLLRRPWRLAGLLAVLPSLLLFLINRDRGALKGSLLHLTLGGLSRDFLQRQATAFVAWLVPHGLFPEALAAIEHHRRAPHRLVLLSASTDLYVPLIGSALGMETVLCTRLRWRADGRLDGRLASANCRGEEKTRQLRALIERERPAAVYAYGNSASDLSHMQLAQEAFLVNATPPRGLPLPGSVRCVRWRGPTRLTSDPRRG